jgi:3-deoxy-D-manno-octulosonic-acid transferase
MRIQKAIYDFLIGLLTLGYIPKLIWDCCKGKKKATLRERLGMKIPDAQGRAVIWIHAVSVGETKAAQPLFLRLKEKFPEAFFLVTHTTWTGREEAKRSLGSADAFAFLPLDFSWIMRRWVKILRPTHFVLIEGDFWFNQLSALKSFGTKIVLASGKISERSARRFKRVSFFAKRLFGFFNLFCVQSEEYAVRFAPFVKDVRVTGNLKFDLEPQKVLVKEDLIVKEPRWVITIACTHAPEEELLLMALEPLFPKLTIFLAPRHPERFDEVAELLEERKIPFVRWSQLEKRAGEETVILIDLMGQLPFCYSNSLLAIVGGSFTDRVGGHNILEPCLYGCPSFFGPYMHGQPELTSHVLKAKAGGQIAISETLFTLEQLLTNSESLEAMKIGASRLFSSGKGSVEKTISLMKKKGIWQ